MLVVAVTHVESKDIGRQQDDERQRYRRIAESLCEEGRCTNGSAIATQNERNWAGPLTDRSSRFRSCWDSGSGFDGAIDSFETGRVGHRTGHLFLITTFTPGSYNGTNIVAVSARFIVVL